MDRPHAFWLSFVSGLKSNTLGMVMAGSSRLSLMKQNPANFATFLLIIWRIALKVIKYPATALTGIENQTQSPRGKLGTEAWLRVEA